MKTVVQCSHCGNRTPQKILNQYSASDKTLLKFPSEKTPDWEIFITYYFHITSCETCKSISVFRFVDFEKNEEELEIMFDDLQNAELMIPEKDLDASIPENIRKFYMEAITVKNISLASFVTMIVKTLEAAFIEQGIVTPGKTLGQQIYELQKKKILPEKLIEVSKKIGFFRNKGAHVNDHKIDGKEADAVQDFLMLFLEYLYVIPAKIKALEVY